MAKKKIFEFYQMTQSFFRVYLPSQRNSVSIPSGHTRNRLTSWLSLWRNAGMFACGMWTFR